MSTREREREDETGRERERERTRERDRKREREKETGREREREKERKVRGGGGVIVLEINKNGSIMNAHYVSVFLSPANSLLISTALAARLGVTPLIMLLYFHICIDYCSVSQATFTSS